MGIAIATGMVFVVGAIAVTLPGTSSGAGSPQPNADPERHATQREVADLLQRRMAAVADVDLDAWLATVDRTHPDVVTTETSRFRSLVALPVAQFSLAADRSSRPLDGDRDSVIVVTTYVLGGGSPALHRDVLTLTRVGTEVVFGSTRPVLAVADGGTLPPWYIEGIRAATAPVDSAVATILWWPSSPTSIADATELVRSGMAEVSKQLAPSLARADLSMPRAIVVAVPATRDQYRALVPGIDEDAAGFAAVTVVVPGAGGADGNQVVVDPMTWSDLTMAERQIVMTHELVHVVMSGATGGGQPLWLSEGLADHVALAPQLRAGVTRTALAPQLASVPAADAAALEPPGTDDFAVAREAATEAYSTAWLAVDYLVRTYGMDAVVDLHVRTAGDVTTSPRQQRIAELDALGVPRETWLVQWRSDLVAQLRPPPR